MKITSDPNTTGSDPTVAGQQVPLLARDPEGNEIDWRAKGKCSNDTDPGSCIDQSCSGCKFLVDLLNRLRADRRTRAVRTTTGSAARERKTASRDEGII